MTIKCFNCIQDGVHRAAENNKEEVNLYPSENALTIVYGQAYCEHHLIKANIGWNQALLLNVRN